MDIPAGAVIWRHLPNILSVLRILMAPPAVLALTTGRYSAALLLILAAGVTDVLDGYLARRFQWTSWLGSVLDPLADKSLVLGAYIALAWLEFVPVWIAVLVVGRDAIIVTGASAYGYLFGSYEMTPMALSKANSGLQVLFAAVVVARLAEFPVSDALVQTLLWAVALMTVGSGLQYVWVWGNKAMAQARKQP